MTMLDRDSERPGARPDVEPAGNGAAIAIFTRYPRSQRFWVQFALAVAVAGLFVLLAINAASNIERQSLRFGLDFLGRPAGFSILQKLIPYSEASTYGRAFVVGLLNTLLVSAVGIAIATILGFLMGFARVAPSRAVRWFASAYVEVLRNLPLLLILFFWYFGLLRLLPPPRQSLDWGGILVNNRGLFLPSAQFSELGLMLLLGILSALLTAILTKGRARQVAWVGVAAISIALLAIAPPVIAWPAPRGLSVAGGLQLIPEFVALTAALSLYSAAYIAEVVRAGIEAVPKGQTEAAEALGFSGVQAARLVVLPQALRLIIPPLTSQYLNLTKNSSLAVAIAYPDLVSVFTGTTLAQTGQAVEIVGITMAVYLTLSLLAAAVLNHQNVRRWA